MNSIRIHTVSSARLRRIAFATVACMIGLATFETAHAVDTAPPRLTVKYDPAQLTTTQGMRALRRKLDSAAREVCPLDSRFDAQFSTVARECRDNAVNEALRKINEARLAEIARNGAKTG